METSPEAKALTDEARAWISPYRPCVQVVFEDYVHSGVWPKADELQQRLDMAAENEVDLWGFADALQRKYGLGLATADPNERRIQLRLRAWYDLGGVATEYAQFVVHAVCTAVDRYRAGSLTLTEGDLLPHQSLPMVPNELARRVLMGLVELESFYFLLPGPPMTERDWQRSIDKPRIRRFLKVATVEDYLIATAQLHAAALPRPPSRSPYAPQEAMTVNNSYNFTIHNAGMVNVNPDTVNVIQSHIEAIASRQPELAEALARLTEEALDAPELNDKQRDYLNGDIKDLSAELQQPPELRDLRRIERFANGIAELAPLAPKLFDVWNQVKGLIDRG